MLFFVSSFISFFLEAFFDFWGYIAELTLEAIAESTRRCENFEVFVTEKSVLLVSHCLMFVPSPIPEVWLSVPARLWREIARLLTLLLLKELPNKFLKLSKSLPSIVVWGPARYSGCSLGSSGFPLNASCECTKSS